MQYLLMIYDTEAAWATFEPEVQKAYMNEYAAFTQAIRDSGHLLGSNRLQPTSTATSVRNKDGKAVVTHGPFAETREQLGGYYLIEAKDLDEATAIAARIPSARVGTIEVRPVHYIM